MTETMPPPTRADAAAAVDGLRLALLALNRDAPTLADRLSTEDCVQFVGLIQRHKGDLDAVAAYVGHELGSKLTKADTRYPDGTRAERTPAYRQDWAEDTAAAVCNDLTTLDGERGEGARLALQRLQKTARLEWRSGEVKTYADVDQLRHRERTHWRVKVTLPVWKEPKS
jgi:hypothetical protein